MPPSPFSILNNALLLALVILHSHNAFFLQSNACFSQVPFSILKNCICAHTPILHSHVIVSNCKVACSHSPFSKTFQNTLFYNFPFSILNLSQFALIFILARKCAREHLFPFSVLHSEFYFRGLPDQHVENGEWRRRNISVPFSFENGEWDMYFKHYACITIF